MTPQEIVALKHELRQFTGSESVYRYSLIRNYVYTEGVRFLAERAGAYWLLDHIFCHQTHDTLRVQTFQVWKIVVHEDHNARLTVEDGNGNTLTKFRVTYTHFPLEVLDLWLVDRTLLLPSEY